MLAHGGAPIAVLMCFLLCCDLLRRLLRVQFGGALLAVSALEIVEGLVNGGHYASPDAIRALSRGVAGAFRNWPTATQALRGQDKVRTV